MPFVGGIIELGTQMSFCRLSNGKILVIDTCQISIEAKAEIDKLTENGDLIEAVIATHPFHTLYFVPFFLLYPNARYYGTPRHLTNISEIPWAGDISKPEVLNAWEPDVSMRIPAGAEFVKPESHFSGVFVFHKQSRMIHSDDTICYFDAHNTGCVLSCCVGIKPGSMFFHTSMKEGNGLYPTADAPQQFKQWVEEIIRDWDFDR